MFDDDVKLLRAAVTGLLTSEDAVRLPTALADTGWLDLWRADDALAGGLLFEEQGASCIASAALDLVWLERWGISAADPVAVIWPAIQRGLEPTSIVAEGRIVIDGIVLAGWDRATEYLTVARGPEGYLLVRLPSTEVHAAAISGIDASAGMASVHASMPVSVTQVTALVGWPDLVALAQRCLGYELVGLARAMLLVASDHVSQRKQFGRPIAALQSVRHRLSDIHVAVTGSHQALDASWTVPGPNGATATLAAKCLAGRAATTAARDGLQLCGAMGFTWEHSFHRLARRAYLLDCLLGPSDWLVDEIGRRILASQIVPRVPAAV